MVNHTAVDPIVVPPSQRWDGNDGPWSTFNIHVGTPPQPARVLASTTVGETWVILNNNTQGGCLSTDPTSCPDSRGGLVNVNISSTWQDQGIKVLGDEVNLPDYVTGYDNGDYGLESLGIGAPGAGGITLNNQVVAGVATKDFYLGNIGLTSRPTNFTDFNDPHPSFLSSLREQNQIPSLTFGYTAGNQYRSKDAYGSLTLGGYDASRFTPNDISFRFAADISRDLVVGLQAITYTDAKNTNKQLSTSGQLTFVDATVPHIWLPKDVCKNFETAFGLTYNNASSRYLVSDSQHNSLLAQNPSISFIVGNTVNGGATVNITLPYAAFDLQTGPPVVNTTSKYFPLRQADNSTQFTLGRTLLQEAYLIVDYENSNFSISPAVFTQNAPTQIKVIASHNNTASNIVKVTQPGASHSLPIGAIVGIVVALVLLSLSGLVAFFFLRRRKRRRRLEEYERRKREEHDPTAKAEMDGNPVPFVGEMHGENKYGAYDGKTNLEMDGTKDAFDAKLRQEMEGSHGLDNKERLEMEGSQQHAEMEGTNFAPVEMYAGPYGLYDDHTEMPSPLVGADGRPSPASRPGSGLPSPASGRPSPATPGGRRSGGFAAWGRRMRTSQRILESPSGEVSSPDVSSRTGSEAEVWSGRRPRPQQRYASQEVPSQSDRSRERQRRGGDLTKRLEKGSRTHESVSSPSASERGSQGQEIRADRWNQRFGSRARGNDPRDSSRDVSSREVSLPRGVSSRDVSLPRDVSFPRDGVRPGLRNYDSWTSRIDSTVSAGRISSPERSPERMPSRDSRPPFEYF